jgi:uncharacterized protein (TIGR03435 family)
VKRLLAVAIAARLWSQTPAPLSFEVASIKQEDTTLPNRIAGGVCHGSDSPPVVGIPGMTVALGRCRYVGAKVKQLLNNAYGVAPDRIVGGPGWIDSLPFSIDAKAEDAPIPTRAQLMQMMRTLLEDRFKLKFHRESKEVPGFALVRGKGGIKLRESTESTPRGSSIDMRGSIKGSMSMSMLAGSLRGLVGAPVTDGTGLTGRYDVDIKWTPDVTPNPPTASDPAGPSIFTALQELGLRLDPQKTTIELFVIDSIEKPTGN